MPVIVNGSTGISGVDGSAGTPALQGSDANTGIRFDTNAISLVTDGSDRLYIDSSGRLLVGTSSSSAITSIVAQGNSTNATGAGVLSLARGTSSISNGNQLGVIDFTDSSDNKFARIEAVADAPPGAGDYPGRLVFSTTADGASSPTERMRIDSSGRLLVGTASAVSADTWNLIQAVDPVGGFLVAARDDTSVIEGDSIGGLRFYGNDSDGIYDECARVECNADGAHTDTSKPSRLRFLTTGDGASSPTERMRISKDGIIRINTGGVNPSNSVNGTLISETGYIWTSVGGDPAAYFNRNTNDGTIVELRQANVTEGTISVSGTTVSYNGAHLSRWSQLPSGAERTEILRGSVLSNIDEMCEWGDEENEQLNRMKVSDVEGDKNVSGVFQAWDDDDDTYTNDFYCAMTGDFIIRIAEGVTVERGDLLMSAGDGTAKPQGDGFVQDKTIAKVTSTNVSCTYDDGSYCVPCVLMAC